MLAGCGNLFARKEAVSARTGTVLPSAITLPEPFAVRLPTVPVLKPVRRDADTDYYELAQKVATAEIIPGTRTAIWGYHGIFPGPTLEARSGRAAEVRVRNELPVPTSMHLHGGVVEPGSDGYPTDLVVPEGYAKRVDASMVRMHAMAAGRGNAVHAHQPVPEAPDPGIWTLHEGEKTYKYAFGQRAATLWYHDHRMDFSAPQVWKGLAGSAIVRDAEEEALGLPAGDRELSLMVCDRSFDAEGQFLYPALDPELSDPAGVEPKYMDGVLGDVILVNGAPWPVKHVGTGRYRLRILNASNARPYNLELTGPDGQVPFTMIGSDGGLLPAPQRLESVPMSPGERFDVVVDFSRLSPGDEVVLGNTLGERNTGLVMKFLVDKAVDPGPAVPAVLSAGYEALERGKALQVRQFDFRLAPGDVWTINGQPFDPGALLASARLGTVELWRFTSDFNHPVHTHLAHFQVISRDGRRPGPADAGWKDTVNVTPYGVVEVLVRFTGFRGKYMLHCHNLEHEDMAMMANFTVV